MANFETAIKKVLLHEGGYVNDPNDAGGETKYGISKRTYPNLDIKNLTEQAAKDIYLKDFWKRYNIDFITNDALAEKVFDTGVNMGMSRSFKFLQQAAVNCGAQIAVDGLVGKKTLDAINKMDAAKLLKEFRKLQADHYEKIVQKNPSQKKFLKGWLNRAQE